ncbi:hypothetical protein [Taibaiella soli]|uniref:Uncharacterized protein n=1 Tax=Taibaiella soli TaxID=1649169 RepID=A0A2W2BLY7_9BACT|nr:hypothetical protein [Taibaiella soli]PZF74456.1 hypothetical protein DN068_02425 [Taibaiella soli]
MKKIVTSIALLFAAGFANQSEAQSVAINSTGNAADTSALLDLTSTAKGILVPRMTSTQKAAIYLPATGLMVFQTDAPAGFYYNSGTGASPVWNLLQTSIANVTTQGNTINAASGLVKLDASAKMPAVDGSALTNLNGSNISSGTVADARLSTNVTMFGNTTVNTANGLVKLDGSAKLPAIDGSQLTNLPASSQPQSQPISIPLVSGTGYTITASANRIYLLNFQTVVPGTFTVTLPAANSYTSGTILHISWVNAGGSITLYVASTSNIYAAGAPATSVNLGNVNNTQFITDGTNWYRI